MTTGRAEARLLHLAETAFVDMDADAPPRVGVGVAVSGGGDSLALLHLIQRCAGRAGWQVAAATIDHQLRPEAADEARRVGATCAAWGVPHTILRWERSDDSGNLQDRARQARLRLLGGWARQAGIGRVALGHTADDQAETFLMRLARGSGLDGLSAMRPRWSQHGVEWVRPLLEASRDELREYLAGQAVDWIEDPSNDDPRFDRVKARRALRALAPLGLTVGTLQATARNLADARAAIEAQTAAVAAEISDDQAGDVVFAAPALLSQPAEIRRRLLIAALHFVAGGGYPPRAGAVAGLEDAIRARRDSTLAGCRILASAGEVRVLREAAAVAGVTCATVELWDGRWQLDGPHAAELHLGALGEAGLAECPDWRTTGLPRASLAAAPAVWRGATLVAAPLAGRAEGWTARLAEGRDAFARSPLSH